MTDVVAAVEESKRGAVVRFESGERLWFGRAAWLERAPLRPVDVEDPGESEAVAPAAAVSQGAGRRVRLLAARARSTGEILRKLTDYGYMDDTVDMCSISWNRRAWWTTRGPLPANGPPRARGGRSGVRASCASWRKRAWSARRRNEP